MDNKNTRHESKTCKSRYLDVGLPRVIDKFREFLTFRLCDAATFNIIWIAMFSLWINTTLTCSNSGLISYCLRWSKHTSHQHFQVQMQLKRTIHQYYRVWIRPKLTLHQYLWVQRRPRGTQFDSTQLNSIQHHVWGLARGTEVLNSLCVYILYDLVITELENMVICNSYDSMYVNPFVIISLAVHVWL